MRDTEDGDGVCIQYLKRGSQTAFWSSEGEEGEEEEEEAEEDEKENEGA